MIKFWNTLTHSIDEFKPLTDEKVKLYTCGPTVYAPAHIGNLRKYLCDDLLYRTLVSAGYKVTRVMNMTDIDDKTIFAAKGDMGEFKALTRKYEILFLENLSELNIIKPEIITRATEYVSKIVKFIEILMEKGYAYKSDDGSVYFSIVKFANYGKLSGLNLDELKVGVRVNLDEYDKENPADFALWKAWSDDDGEIFWQTSLGKGRPGWHIECSVMATDTLGQTIDIHTGGVDNIFPHHENEIAQSEAESGQKFVNFWLHYEHLLVDGKKMAKSANNFYVLDDLKEKGFSGLDFRYFCLGAHYRTKINFTWEGLEGARNARMRLKRIIKDLELAENGKVNGRYSDQFNLKISSDLDSPGALAILWELVRDNKISSVDKLATIRQFDEVLGLDLLNNQAKIELNIEQQKLIDDREKARQAGNWAKADEIRATLAKMHIQVEDTADSTKVTSSGI